MRQLNVFLSQISCAVFLSFSSLVLASNLSLTDAENAALVADPAIAVSYTHLTLPTTPYV